MSIITHHTGRVSGKEKSVGSQSIDVGGLLSLICDLFIVLIRLVMSYSQSLKNLLNNNRFARNSRFRILQTPCLQSCSLLHCFTLGSHFGSSLMQKRTTSQQHSWNSYDRMQAHSFHHFAPSIVMRICFLFMSIYCHPRRSMYCSVNRPLTL